MHFNLPHKCLEHLVLCGRWVRVARCAHSILILGMLLDSHTMHLSCFIPHHHPAFFCFLGPHPPHLEISKLGVQLEMYPPAYTTATTPPDPSGIFNLYHSSCKCWVLNPLRGVLDGTRVLMYTSQVCFHWAMMGTPPIFPVFFFFFFCFFVFLPFLGLLLWHTEFPG